MLLLRFCLEYSGSAHGSYYPEGFSIERKGAGDCICIMSRGVFFSEAPCLLCGGEDGLVSF